MRTLTTETNGTPKKLWRTSTIGTRSASDKVQKAVKWYVSQRLVYKGLAKKVEQIIREVLDAEGINYYNISSRAKEIEKYQAKAEKKEYRNPIKEIKDMAGIRVIAYVDSEARHIADKIRSLFIIDPKHSVDKAKDLGVNRVGYRSIHYVAKLHSQRCKLPEFQRFSNLQFEIQVRTILQHAWAEIEHDRNYKFTGILPDEIQRRFALLAGLLEIADRDFDNISEAINSYTKDIAAKTASGDLEIPLNTTALREYLEIKFSKAISAGLNPLFGRANSMAKDIIQELTDFGISSLADLDNIIPSDFEEKYIRSKEIELMGGSNFSGVLRIAMIMVDADRYFEHVWDKKWTFFDSEPCLELLGIDVQRLREKYMARRS